MADSIPIYMANDDASQFLVFQEHFKVFEEMQKAGAFGVEWGNVKLSFANSKLLVVSVEHVVRVDKE